MSGDALWTGHPASRSVVKLDLTGGSTGWSASLGCQPASLARQGPLLLAACFDTGEIVSLDAGTGQVLERRWAGYGPFGLIASQGRIYLTLSHENRVLVLDPQLRPLAEAATGREPSGIALMNGRLYVADLLDASVDVFDAEGLNPVGKAGFGFQGTFSETVASDPGRGLAYVPHQRQNITNMARLFDSTVSPVVGVMDLETLQPLRNRTMTLDTMDTPVSLPIASVLSADGKTLFVANAGSEDVSVIDLDSRKAVGHVVVGGQPRDLAVSEDGKSLYTLNLVSDDITVVDLESMTVTRTIPLAADPRPLDVQLGEHLFSTSRPDTVAKDNWMACASCHLDGGFDGRTWLGTTGGPRNTPSVRGIAGTEPLHWSGDRANVQAFEATFTGLMGGAGLSKAELDALAAYVDSLASLPSPKRGMDGGLSEGAVTGAGVFRNAGCAACHVPPLFTDRQRHDVGTGLPTHPHPQSGALIAESRGPEFDTPALRELWLTAPYLHDGRAATVGEVLTAFNPDGSHGRTAGLTRAQLSALEEFLLSLPLSRAEADELFPN